MTTQSGPTGQSHTDFVIVKNQYHSRIYPGNIRAFAWTIRHMIWHDYTKPVVIDTEMLDEILIEIERANLKVEVRS